MQASPPAGYISIIEVACSLSFATNELWGLQPFCISIPQGWRSSGVAPSPAAHRKWTSWLFPVSLAAAIYAWALCLPAVTIGAIGNVMAWLQRPLYRQADIFARAGTIGGMRFMRDTGFVASAFRTPDLWIYQRRLH